MSKRTPTTSANKEAGLPAEQHRTSNSNEGQKTVNNARPSIQPGTQRLSLQPASRRTSTKPQTGQSKSSNKSTKGNEQALLSPENRQKYSVFTDEEVKGLTKLYQTLDKSGGKEGIVLELFISLPDFVGCPFIRRICEIHIPKGTDKISPEAYMDILAVLSPKAAIDMKRKLAFNVLDIHNQGVLRHDEIFRMFKLIFRSALTDNQILDLVLRVLNRGDIETRGMLTYTDFNRLTSDSDIHARFTANLQLP
ncbi:calcineurin subunit B-like [Tubulanus polymorphus]|uniref:calcineurin subunit B-like n=1 Tax=Tubulanus polymorphus TaxID=672921 RepID=UPI003DA62C11